MKDRRQEVDPPNEGPRNVDHSTAAEVGSQSVEAGIGIV